MARASHIRLRRPPTGQTRDCSSTPCLARTALASSAAAAAVAAAAAAASRGGSRPPHLDLSGGCLLAGGSEHSECLLAGGFGTVRRVDNKSVVGMEDHPEQ